MDCMEKYELLLENLKQYGKLCVAYSGGTDSTLLLKAATEAISNDNVIAVIADTVFISETELEDAEKFAKSICARCFRVNIDLLHIPQIAQNETNRCYHCKKTIFVDVSKAAFNYGIKTIVDGTNADDSTVYRPGTAALSELGIVSPLRECGITKKDVREISERLELPTWNLPTNSCFATRFPHETEITPEKLKMVEKGEQYLKDLGIEGVIRFRTHGDLARIEVEKSEFGKLAGNLEVAEFVKSMGYKYVVLDLEGYRTGSMDSDV